MNVENNRYYNVPCDYALSRKDAIKKARGTYSREFLTGITYQGAYGAQVYLNFDDMTDKERTVVKVD